MMEIVNNTEFAHYGVLGMKWGVHKFKKLYNNNQKKEAGNTILNMINKNDKKAAKRKLRGARKLRRSAKLERRAAKALYKGKGKKYQKYYYRAIRKKHIANKRLAKAEKLEYRNTKLAEKINHIVGETKIKGLNTDLISKGKKYYLNFI